MSEKNLPRIGFTMGDPNGIGAEILLKALQKSKPFTQWSPVILGDRFVLNAVNEQLQTMLLLGEDGRETDCKQVSVLDLGEETKDQWKLGTISAWAGKSAFRFLLKGIEMVQSRQLDALCTAPICKEALHLAGIHFPGHTEILSHYTTGEPPLMMLAVGQLRAILVSIHQPLQAAIASLTTEKILSVLRIAKRSLQQLGIASPRFGIPGVNPHAGENGLFGTEEISIIQPAIALAQQEGIACEGPFSPDTIFLHHQDGRFDAVISMYHDQALIPLKLLGFEQGVNITLGLPIIRTSVDHGTAFDRATHFNSNPNSMLAAIRMACELVEQRTLAYLEKEIE